MTKSTAYARAAQLRARGWPTRVVPPDRQPASWELWVVVGPFVHLLWGGPDNARLVKVRGI